MAGQVKHTVQSRLETFGNAVRSRLAPHFRRLAIAYPPERITLVGVKHDRRLEVWVWRSGAGWGLLCSYPILAMSGGLGPKLSEGDLQTPEGIYPVESLNPNSICHVALRVGYPNAFDREQARPEGRTNPGSDIMIHGGVSSVGCLAMGDEAAEDLFVLAADAGIENVQIILTPVDFRTSSLPDCAIFSLPWLSDLYQKITGALSALTVSSNHHQ